MSFDLSIPGMAKALATQIKHDIDAFCVSTYDDGPRTHLGASVIGHECLRKIWFDFRWIYYVVHGGRMQRLFKRGHLEEHRFEEWFKGIGFQIIRFDDNSKQAKFSACNGHFGGSQDGRLEPPERYGVSIPVFLAEFKTSGTGSKFTKLLDKGVRIAKPEHFDQMCQYGFAQGFDWAIYACINKNDDDLHIEVIQLDQNNAREALRKADYVINSPLPPARCSQSENYVTCKMCDYKAKCWNFEQIDKNCRSCSNAVPIENAQWGCKLHKVILEKSFIPKGCVDHVPIYSKDNA